MAARTFPLYAVLLHLFGNLRNDPVCVFVGHLAGADLTVAAAAVVEQQAAHIRRRGTVGDAVADGNGHIGFVTAVNYPQGNIWAGYMV